MKNCDRLVSSDNSAESFESLFLDHRAKVYRLALSLAGNAHDAEDITQEAFLRAFRSYHTFRGNSSFFTWIYRITMNAAKDYLKQRTKMPLETLTEDLGFSLEEVIDPNPANNPETELLGYQARIRCLHAMTECLPLEQRKVFCLAITLGLPHKVIAEILDCSVASVKTTLHRAKQRWFGYMENKCRLIKKSNPCNCRQFVRFGLSQGWISKAREIKMSPVIPAQARKDVVSMRTLRDIYSDMYRDKADALFIERMKNGIKNKEWPIFS
jgi:RNA polymerase sigma-70 factor (ECF subfamily)